MHLLRCNICKPYPTSNFGPGPFLSSFLERSLSELGELQQPENSLGRVGKDPEPRTERGRVDLYLVSVKITLIDTARCIVVDLPCTVD